MFFYFRNKQKHSRQPAVPAKPCQRNHCSSKISLFPVPSGETERKTTFISIPLFLKRDRGYGGKGKTSFPVKRSFSLPPASSIHIQNSAKTYFAEFSWYSLVKNCGVFLIRSKTISPIFFASSKKTWASPNLPSRRAFWLRKGCSIK